MRRAVPSMAESALPSTQPPQTADAGADFDVSIEDVDMNPKEEEEEEQQPTSAAVDNAGAGGNPTGSEAREGEPTAAGSNQTTTIPGALPASMDPMAAATAPPSKKETSLREFLSKMDEYAPIVRPILTYALYIYIVVGYL